VQFSALTFEERWRVTALAKQFRLPCVYGFREYVEAGGLIAYGPIFRDNFEHAAAQVDKILRGAKPADLPIEQPTRFELVVNQKAAKLLSLTVPQSIRASRRGDRMRRRDVLLAAGAVVVGIGGVRAQQDRVPVVGYLGISARAPLSPFLAAFYEVLRRVGYVEGRNVAFEYRWADGRRDLLPELAAELVAARVDVITTSGGVLAAQAAKQATSTIPIVFETGVDPVAAGLVSSMARPGGNLTAVAILTGELNPKRFELLTEMVPHAAAIALLVNSKNAVAERVIEQVQKAARSKGVRVEIVSASNDDGHETAFALARDRAGRGPRRERCAVLQPARAAGRAGGTPCHPGDVRMARFRRDRRVDELWCEPQRNVSREGAATSVWFLPANPAELPTMQAAKFELVINMRTAHALGLAVPQSLLARADDVIE
jgi:putative ABC transport system substrate-binding protein